MLNKTRHRLLFSSCIFALSLGSVLAFAGEPDHYFFPKNKWTVERVKLSSDHAPLSCVIRNEFNNGYVIQISGHAKGFSNINIDFRQNVFQKGFKYEAKYSVPGISSALVPTKAFKESLLVSDLRKQQDFFNDVLSAGAVDVQIRDNSFRLYMTGLSAAMKNFTACLTPDDVIMADAEATPPQSENAVEPPAGDDAEYVPGKGVDLAVGTVAQNLVAGGESQDVDDARGVISAPSAMTVAQQAAVITATAQVKSVAGVALAHVENDSKPQAQIVQAPAPRVDIPEIIDDITAMNEKLEAKSGLIDPTESQDTGQEAEKVTRVAKSPKPVFTREKIVHERVADFTKPRVSGGVKTAALTPETDIDRAAIQSASLQPASGVAQEQHSATAKKIQLMEEKIEQLTRENEMLDEELQDVLDGVKSERLSVSSDNWNLEKATIKFDEAERQIMRLGRQLQSHRAACDAEKAELERMLFDPTLTNQQQIAKLTELENSLVEAKNDLIRQQQRYEERIRLLEQRLNAL